MNDGSMSAYYATVPGHKCRECVYFAVGAARCYCPVRNKQVTATMTACVYGKARNAKAGERL